MLAGFFLFLALRGLDWAGFATSIRTAKYWYLPLIFIWGSLTSGMRAIRWRVLLTTERDIPAKNVFWANMAGYLGNNILPARAGELIRAMYVGRENNIPASFALATGLVERFIDLLALILLGSVSLAFVGIVSGPFQVALKTLSVVAVVGIIGLALAPYIGNRLLNLVAGVPLLKTSAGKKLLEFADQFLRGIEALHHPKRITLFLLYTSMIWLMDGIGTILMAHALHFNLILSQSFVLLAGLGLSSAIPSTPGYVGVYQFVAINVLAPFGISSADALAFILFLQIINLLIVIVWGGAAMLRPSPSEERTESATGKPQ